MLRPDRPLSLALYLVELNVGRRGNGVERRCAECDRDWGRVLPRFAMISSNEESRSMNVKQVLKEQSYTCGQGEKWSQMPQDEN